MRPVPQTYEHGFRLQQSLVVASYCGQLILSGSEALTCKICYSFTAQFKQYVSRIFDKINVRHWSFAEKTFVKQSMMLEWEKCAEKLRFHGGGVNHTDTKLYRHQIIQIPNHTWRFGICMIWCLYDLPPPKSPSPIWYLYNLVSVWFGVCMIYPPPPPNRPVWFGCLYDLVYVQFTPPPSPSLLYPEIS